MDITTQEQVPLDKQTLKPFKSENSAEKSTAVFDMQQFFFRTPEYGHVPAQIYVPSHLTQAASDLYAHTAFDQQYLIKRGVAMSDLAYIRNECYLEELGHVLVLDKSGKDQVRMSATSVEKGITVSQAEEHYVIFNNARKRARAYGEVEAGTIHTHPNLRTSDEVNEATIDRSQLPQQTREYLKIKLKQQYKKGGVMSIMDIVMAASNKGIHLMRSEDTFECLVSTKESIPTEEADAQMKIQGYRAELIETNQKRIEELASRKSIEEITDENINSIMLAYPMQLCQKLKVHYYTAKITPETDPHGKIILDKVA